jgi:GNAT superfamily N-acetyltransferase
LSIDAVPSRLRVRRGKDVVVDIRPARPADLPLLPAIELRAGELFRAIGMDEIAEDDPGDFHPDDLLFVAELDGLVVAYVLVLEVDGALHVEQVSVVPEAAGRRIGAALIDRVADLARQRGSARLTLTTFRDVPWNMPYYQRLGFTVLDDLGPELAALVAHERTVIPGDAPRVVMQRPV